MDFFLGLLMSKWVWVLVVVVLAVIIGVILVVNGALTSGEAKNFFSKPAIEATLGDICFILFIFGCLVSK